MARLLIQVKQAKGEHVSDEIVRAFEGERERGKCCPCPLHRLSCSLLAVKHDSRMGAYKRHPT
jgi:hypothetical protein